MYRGLLDGVDMAMMVHGMTKGSGVNEDDDTDLDFQALLGMNGCIAKNIRYKGKSAHAGGAPHMGVNAEYAAMLGLQACNDLRETFQEKDTIRFHPILMGANCAVNIIPDEMKIESYVNRRVEIPAYLIFSPVFFASIGMKTNLDGLNGSMILFSIILLIIAILSKVVGCGLGAKYASVRIKKHCGLVSA